MKFRLIIEPGSKTLAVIPEDEGEARLLAGVCDPNSRHTEHAESQSASVHVVASDDRVPYKKVKELHITL